MTGAPETDLHPRAAIDLFGHAEAERVLLDAFNSGRLAHAWLICGPRGIGKATLAYRFARFLLVQGRGGGADAGPGLFGDALPPVKPESLRVEPEHPVFQRVLSGGHGDLLAVERRFDEKTGKRKTEILVDDVRGVGAFMSMTASEGGWRVVIVDAADEMNRNAANALLKVLEEPPDGAVLLLVAHNPGRLLPTILSRCRRLVLRPLEEDILTERIAHYRPDLGGPEAVELARLAEGSLGRALTLADEGGLELFREVAGLLETLPRLDVVRLHALCDKVARPGADDAFRTLGDLVRSWLGRLIVFGARGPVGIGASEAEKTLMARLLQSAALDRWLEVWEKISRLLAQADGLNLDRKQVVLNLFLALETASRP